MENINIEAVDVKELASRELQKNLVESLLAQVKMMPKPWRELTEAEQSDCIDAFKRTTKIATDCAVRLIASNGATVVVGDLDSITIKDGVKAVIKVASDAENLEELYKASGLEVLITVAGQVTNEGLDDIKPDPDQKDIFDEAAKGFEDSPEQVPQLPNAR